jgi:epsilon-lactone hydrolase
MRPMAGHNGDMTDESADVLAMRQTPDAIELRHLRAFVAVAEELNFSRAANRLYLSQPALSRQISALERLVGCDLLRRSTHRVELTLAGEALLDRTRTLLADLDSAVSATRSVGGELVARVNQMWAPVTGLGPDSELETLRTAYEGMLAQTAVPEGVVVRPLTAGGVPALQVSGFAELPRILHLHGGGFVAGSAYGYRALAGALSLATGAGVLVPDYRLAPEHPFPAALDDARNGYLWMLEQGVPAAEVVISGDSSGGGLAMSLLISLRDDGLPLPAGAVLLCPGLDLASVLDGASPVAPTIDLPGIEVSTDDNAQTVSRVASWYIGDHPADDPLLSPLVADPAGLPPLLIQAATGDVIATDARGLAERAAESGVEAVLELYPVDTHVFQLFWSFLPEAREAMIKIGEFTTRLTAATEKQANSRP